MNGVRVFVSGKKFEILKKTVGKSAQRVIKALNKDNSLVEVYLISNKQMRFLNKRFRGKNETTSVLSFNEPKNFPHPEIKKKGGKIRAIGEIYLNPGYIKERKKEKRKNVLNKLLVHGLLHLLGYNHKKKNDRIRMEKKEKKILANLH